MTSGRNDIDAGKPRVVLFDFDGTLTRRDTLLAIIAFAHGRARLALWLALHTPQLAMMRLGFCDNGLLKQRLFAHFFGGTTEAGFDALCQQFARENAAIMRPAGLDAVAEAVDSGAQVLVVTASIDRWVRPFFARFDDRVTVVGTQIEVRDGIVTGRFATRNCHGAEKVSRIRQLIDDIDRRHVTAFGDSRGDREMLAMADEAHYRAF